MSGKETLKRFFLKAFVKVKYLDYWINARDGLRIISRVSLVWFGHFRIVRYRVGQ